MSSSSRTGKIDRETNETKISVSLNLDESGPVSISSGIGFFDHMLNSFSRHGGFGLSLSCRGDLEIDAHHSMEDTGLALGLALRDALGDKRGITRFGHSYVPLDESLSRVVIDLSGRPHLTWEAEFPEAEVGGVSCRLYREFFQALVNTSCITLHVDLLRCGESHHGMESIFKAFGRALRMAVERSGSESIPSTKGTLS